MPIDYTLDFAVADSVKAQTEKISLKLKKIKKESCWLIVFLVAYRFLRMSNPMIATAMIMAMVDSAKYISIGGKTVAAAVGVVMPLLVLRLLLWLCLRMSYRMSRHLQMTL